MQLSRNKAYKDSPKERYGHTCLACVYEDEKEALKLKLARSKEMKKFEREQRAKQKIRLKDGVKSEEIAYAAVRTGLALTMEALEKVRKDAKTLSQKRKADTLLRRLLKERAKALKDMSPEELPPHLRFDPDSMLPQSHRVLMRHCLQSLKRMSQTRSS